MRLNISSDINPGEVRGDQRRHIPVKSAFPVRCRVSWKREAVRGCAGQRGLRFLSRTWLGLGSHPCHGQPLPRKQSLSGGTEHGGAQPGSQGLLSHSCCQHRPWGVRAPRPGSTQLAAVRGWPQGIGLFPAGEANSWKGAAWRPCSWGVEATFGRGRGVKRGPGGSNRMVFRETCSS